MNILSNHGTLACQRRLGERLKAPGVSGCCLVHLLQEMEEMEPPAELLMPLLPYQKQFLGWALRQEQGDIKGGILADEMGMGKTIQVPSRSLQSEMAVRKTAFCRFSVFPAHHCQCHADDPSIAGNSEAVVGWGGVGDHVNYTCFVKKCKGMVSKSWPAMSTGCQQYKGLMHW